MHPDDARAFNQNALNFAISMTSLAILSFTVWMYHLMSPMCSSCAVSFKVTPFSASSPCDKIPTNHDGILMNHPSSDHQCDQGILA